MKHIVRKNVCVCELKQKNTRSALLPLAAACDADRAAAAD